MPSYAALLRGINLGGRNKVAMADLRQVAIDLGHARVATYIQSGNLVFNSPGTDQAALADDLEREISLRLGVSAAVVVVSREEIDQVITGNPFPAPDNPRLLHAVFRREEMSPAGHAAVDQVTRAARDAGSRDDARVIGRTLYLHTPDGFGRSDLALRLGRSAAQADGTARNWATVLRLKSMLDSASEAG
jgi:uncharacterized protein (DUF1697 family)